MSGGSHLSEENNYMDDTSRDIYLSSESLERHCATFFRALCTAAGGDGMRKKDTEIPPKRAF
jgi:hypothetical protein